MNDACESHIYDAIRHTLQADRAPDFSIRDFTAWRRSARRAHQAEARRAHLKNRMQL